ncbi:MAG: TonB-dependent receptor [Rhodovarius sp.]|nr:TonB-dependent receptor [Rhodovarius sp.]
MLSTALFLLPEPAAAQTAIPDTIVTAARVPVATERVPVATTTITRQDIEERGYVTLADALAQVPGLALVGQGGPGALTSLFMRGLNSNHVQVLLDGVPINDPTTPTNLFNFGSLLLAGVERIEVLRGPASSLYGSNALAGVVNIVTRRAPPGKQAEVFGGIAGGTQRTLRLDGGVAGTVGAFDYLFALDSLSTAGFNILPPRLATNRGEADGYRGVAAVARLGWAPLPGSRIEATLRWQEASIRLDRFAADDPNFVGEERRWTGQVRAETALFGGAWVTGLRFGTTRDRRQYDNLPDAFSAATLHNLFRGERTVLDWGNRVLLPDLLGGLAQDGALSFGAGWARERSDSAYGQVPFRTTVSAAQESASGHLALQYRLLRTLDVSAGMRLDHVQGYGTTPTYRLGAVQMLPEWNLRLRAAVGSGFAAPSLEQRFGSSAFFVGNPALRPERTTSWELGVEFDVDAPTQPRILTLGATYYRTWARDLIDARFAGGVFRPINVARASVEGVETTAVLRLSPWLEARAAWTWTEAINSDTRQRLLRRPPHIFAFSARLVPVEGLSVVPEVLMTSWARDFLVLDSGAPGPQGRKPGGTTANLALAYQVMPQVNLFLQARNLGNSRWEPTSGYATPGRSVVFGTRFAL